MKKNSFNTFEYELPAHYTEVLSVDATDKRFAIWMNVWALFLAAVISVLAYFLIKPTDFLRNYSSLRALVAIASLFLYILLHELVHGLAYKSLTHEKLTFGLTLSVAYCGVPNIYVYRRTALIALLAPFLLFTLVFLIGIIWLTDPWDKLYAAVVFSFHVGGCIGDLYDTYLYMTKLKDPMTLMQDTGPKQTFYQQLSE